MAACMVCGGDCAAFPDLEHLSTYPFLPGGRDPMADIEYVITPERIVDTEMERVVYSPGARVPMADAIKYGLIDPKAKPAETPAKPARKGVRKRKPSEDRARKPTEDR